MRARRSIYVHVEHVDLYTGCASRQQYEWGGCGVLRMIENNSPRGTFVVSQTFVSINAHVYGHNCLSLMVERYFNYVMMTRGECGEH